MNYKQCYQCYEREQGKNPFCETYVESRKTELIAAGESCHWAKVVKSDLEKIAQGNDNLTFPDLKDTLNGD